MALKNLTNWLLWVALMAAIIAYLGWGARPNMLGLFIASGLAVGSLYALGGIGIVVLYRATGVLNFASGAAGAAGAMTAWQLVAWGWWPPLSWLACVLVALVLFTLVLFLVTDHRRLQRYTYTSGVAGVVLLLLPLVPILGTSINGARLWVRLGPFSFQPSELAKIALTIFFAGYLVRKREALATVRRKVLGLGIPRGRDFGPLLVAWLVALGVLAFERDLGTALMFFGVFVILLYVSTQRRSWLIIGAGLFALAAVLGYLAFGHVQLRVKIWLDPWTYANDEGYQLVQALFGLASGGLFGTGLGEGYPQFIPFAKTDFIAAALGEELGLAGMMAIVMLFAILVERGLRTGLACRDPFGTLLAVGLSSVFALQVLVTIGGVTRLIPLTGLTTPFLSYGGSALVCNWMMIALLLRISDRNRRPAVIAQSADEAMTQMIRVGIDR